MWCDGSLVRAGPWLEVSILAHVDRAGWLQREKSNPCSHGSKAAFSLVAAPWERNKHSTKMVAIFLSKGLALLFSLLAIAHGSDLGTVRQDHAISNLNERHQRPNKQGSWLGWGNGIYNNRWANSDALVDSSNVDSLHSICRKNYIVGESAAPLVVEGVAYYPTWNGLLVALDYKRCTVLWQKNVTNWIDQYNATYLPILVEVASRTTPAISGETLFIGTLAKALLLAVNKRNGKLIDAIQVSDHPVAMVTQSVTVWQGRVFVGSSSAEETAADTIPGYVCCSFIATMNGIGFKHNRFKLLWSQPMIPAGSNFSGAAIWGSQPAIDPKRKQVFIATGNVYSVPPSYEACSEANANSTSTDPGNSTDPCAPREVYQEALLAFDTATGKINWSHQLSPLDAWNVACLKGFPGGGQNPGACPESPGPDADFGIAPTFVPASQHTPSGEDTLVVGQKNGNLYALAASDGSLFWAKATSPDGTIGGLIWGIAVDATTAYYTAVNTGRKPWKFQDGTELSNGAFGAASIATGKILWETQVPRNSTSLVSPTVVNDVVLVGVGGPYLGTLALNSPGSFLSLEKSTGTIIKEVPLDHYFQAGIAVVNDYVLFGMGYRGQPNGSFNVWRLSK